MANSKSTNLTLELDHYGLTWGELRAFVKLGADIPDEDEVDPAFDDHGDRSGFRIIGVTIPNGDA